jgi:hypothetical protein
MRTVRTTSLDGPRGTRVAWTVRDVPAYCSPNHFPPKATGQPDQNEGAQEHAKNAKNIWAKPSTRTVRTQHADGSRGANRRGNISLKTNSRAPYHLSFQGSPKRLKLLRKDLGKMWSVPRASYAPKHGSSNNLNRRESKRHRNQPKT